MRFSIQNMQEIFPQNTSKSVEETSVQKVISKKRLGRENILGRNISLKPYLLLRKKL